MTGSIAEAAGRRMRANFRRLVTAPQFAAVIDCVFDLPRRTSPAFAELCVVDGRLLFARAAGDDAFRHFVGRRDQLAANLLGFVRHLDLGEAERAFVIARIDAIPERAARLRSGVAPETTPCRPTKSSCPPPAIARRPVNARGCPRDT